MSERQPTTSRRMRYDKPKDFRNSMSKLLKYSSKYKVSILIVAIFSVLSTGFNILGPRILVSATNEIVRGVSEKIAGRSINIDFQYILKIIAILATLYVISAIFSYIQSYIMAKVSTGLAYDLRRDLMKKINNLPLSYFNDDTFGNVLSRITNDVDSLNNSLNQSVTQSISSITSIIGVLIMMFSISFQLTMASVVLIPIMILLLYLIINKSQVYFKNQQNILGDLNGKIEEDFSGHQIIKAFNQEKERIKLFNEKNKRLYDSAWKAQFFSGLMMPIMNFVSNLIYVLICILGSSMAINGQLTIGEILAFIQYVRNFTQPVMQLGNIFNQLQITAAAAERIFNLLEEDEDTDNATDSSIDINSIKGNIEFKNVSFSYGENSPYVLKNISVSIKAGEKVAIVGPTGSGKTTIAKLLLRFYDLEEGSIEIDGHNIKEFSKSDLRKLFSMVLQDTWLFNGSIMENIRYGKTEASTEEVCSVAQSAQINSFIDSFPNGYSTVINEEATNISQGQKQLLTIARSMLSKGNILIFDEATSSVDTRTEVMIQKAMDNLSVNRTSFIIAHRLSTIKNADIILVLNNGKLVEKGSHEVLMNKDGFYASLYNSQFK